VLVGAAKLGATTVRLGVGGSGCVAVLVDEPAAGSVTSDRLAWADRCGVVEVVRCALVEAAAGTPRKHRADEYSAPSGLLGSTWLPPRSGERNSITGCPPRTPG